MTVGQGAEVRVVVIDDHLVVAQGVVQLLHDSPIEVVACAENVREGIDMCGVHQPDVVLLDLRVGESLGGDAVPEILENAPNAKIVIFTAFPGHPAVASALANGAVGCVVKDVSRTDLVSVLTSAAKGGPFDPGRSTPKARDRRGNDWLSPREMQILQHVAVGRTNAEIADELYLASSTIKTYWQSALGKLNSRNRAEAITTAHSMGLL